MLMLESTMKEGFKGSGPFPMKGQILKLIYMFEN